MTRNLMLSACGTGALWLSLAASSAWAQSETLDTVSHIHGISAHADDVDSLYVATHEGLYIASRDGSSTRVSRQPHDLMTLAADPASPGTLYTSGHPVEGGNLGLMVSRDGGRRFDLLSPGAETGPVDFHQLAISPANPKVMYGVHEGLQVSEDGGQRWRKIGPVPEKLLQLSGSAKDSRVLYGATEIGLFISHDQGLNWEQLLDLPTTMVKVNAQGQLFAFVVGKGLIMRNETQETWTTLNNRFGSQLLMQLDFAPQPGDRWYALNQYGRLLASEDGGRSWQRFTGKPAVDSAAAQRGEAIYNKHCQDCHGVDGVGETFSAERMADPFYVFAPALDDSMHTWHHTDEQLIETIINGSAGSSRMPAWGYMQENTLYPEDAQDLVAYIKTLWGARELACQGPGFRTCL